MPEINCFLQKQPVQFIENKILLNIQIKVFVANRRYFIDCITSKYLYFSTFWSPHHSFSHSQPSVILVLLLLTQKSRIKNWCQSWSGKVECWLQTQFQGQWFSSEISQQQKFWILNDFKSFQCNLILPVGDC